MLDHPINFYERHGGRWRGPEILAGEKQAQRFLLEWKLEFQRQHGELPANGVDYKLEQPIDDVFTCRPAVGAEIERQSYATISECREVLQLEGSIEDKEIPLRVHKLIESMRRSLAKGDDALETGQGKGSALHEIVGILGQALTTMGVEVRR